MLTVLQTALEVGLIYGLVALALFISFSILNIADLSTDGCFTLGCAVGAMLTIAAPNMKDYVHLAKIKSNARKLRALSGKGDETDA